MRSINKAMLAIIPAICVMAVYELGEALVSAAIEAAHTSTSDVVAVIFTAVTFGATLALCGQIFLKSWGSVEEPQEEETPIAYQPVVDDWDTI